jgi:hypothetical protein
MADIDIEYESITGVAQLLLNAQTDITPSISNLATQVDNLLQQDGGLWMSQTSPAIQLQYNTFNTAAQQCCAAIGEFYTMFTTLVQNLTSMDQNMAYSIAHPSSS